MLDYVAYIAVKILNKVFGLVPVSACLWLGRRLGTLAFFVNKKRRVIAYANLKSAFSAEKSPAQLRSITKKVYQNLVQTVMEILNLTKVNKKYIDRYVEVVNIKRMHDAAGSGRGTILLTGHFGDWELSSLVSAIIGYPIMVLVREQKMERVNGLLNQLRESKGCKVIPKGISTKNILRALYDKTIVGILSDQDAGKNGTFINFFGRPTSCHSGPMEMAKRTDSIVIPNFIVRTRGPYHKLYLEEYIDFRSSKGGDDVRDGLQKFASLLESYIRKYPDQWLWLHKRWKSTPLRTVLVLNDGKQGHLNQSLGVAKEIQKARSLKGYRNEDTRIAVVGVKFRNRFARTILSICAAFANWRCQGCMRCMRYCLAEDSYRALMGAYSDFVVSCGSSLAGVNVFMSKENNAKNIVIMEPTGLPFRKFNLLVIPKHDRPREAKNVILTNIAPNSIDDEKMKYGGERILKDFSLKRGGAYIGVLIGGDNPEFSLTADIADKVINGLLKSCERYGARLLVTTSRRTGGEVEALLKRKLKGDPRCGLLIIANESNFEGAVGGILSLSKVAVVSGESISMVSEAISSGKRTIVFNLAKKTEGLTKHECALRNLANEGYIDIVTADQLSSAAERAWKETRPVKKIADREAIFEAVRRMI